MRRVGRGGSPEVVAGPCDYSSPCSSAESNFRELDDVFLQTQTRIWLGEVLHVRFDEETSITDLLADGELLFQVSKVVWRKLVKKHAELKYSKVYIHERASFCKSGGRYMAYPKVDSFLRICQILGLTGVDLFSPSDVVEKRGTRRVCMCVRSLSKKARRKDLNVPDFDIVTYTIAMPTYMVGSIRRRLELSLWSSTNSNGCTPCMDLKEIYRQRSLDSDYMWHHSSCSESDDADDTYRECELHSPASITSYDDADIYSLIAENLPGSGLVAEENIYPSQNLFTLSWEQNEDMFTGVQSVENIVDTSMHFPHSNGTSNGNLQVDTMCCRELSPPCRTCLAHLDARTYFASTEDISWLQTKISSGTEIHKFDFSHSPAGTSSSRKLASRSDSCLAFDVKEKSYESSTSMQDDSIKFFSESYGNPDSAKEEFSKVTFIPCMSKKPFTCSAEDYDAIDSTSTLLLDKISKGKGRHVLECNNGPSEGSSADLIDSLCENRHPEVQLRDTEGKVAWDTQTISDLNSGSYLITNLVFGSPDPLSGNSDSVHQNINNCYSVSTETVADDQSCSHIEGSNVNQSHPENKISCEVGDAEVSLIASHNSGNNVTVICEDLSDTNGCVQFPGFQSSEKNSQIGLTDELRLQGHPGSIVDESSSTLNKETQNEIGLDSVSSKLCNLSVGNIDLDMDSAISHESQASNTDRDPHTLDVQNQALIDDNFLDVSHRDSVSKELLLCQVSVGCSESDGNYPPSNGHCSHFTDVIQGASDSSSDCKKQSNGFLSPNEDTFSAVEEQTVDFCDLSLDSFSRVNDSPLEKELIFEKLIDEDCKSYSSAFEDVKQIHVNSFRKNEAERQSSANCHSKASALDENTKAPDENIKAHQIAVVDGKTCRQSMENQMVNNLWMEGLGKQTVGSQPSITEREEKSLATEPGKTCCPSFRISDEPVEIEKGSFVEPCAGDSMDCCIKDKVQQGIDYTGISEVPKDKCLIHNETVPGSLAEESSVSILHHLEVNPTESKGSEEIRQIKIQKMDSDVLFGTSLPVVEFSERQVSVGTWHDHLNQTEACTSKNEGLEITLASDKDCLHADYLDTNVGSINRETCTHVCFSDSHSTAHYDSVSSTGLEFRSSCVQMEESPCSTGCVLDMKNSTDQNIAVNDARQPRKDEGANSVYHNDFASTATLKKDVEDGDRRSAVRPEERKREEAAQLGSKPAKKILLKSFAGGMTILGALFLLLHFRGKDRGSVATNVVKSQIEKASHERRPDKDKHRRLYPAEKFKF